MVLSQYVNGKFRFGVLALLGVVVIVGAIGTILSHDSAGAILGLCTLVCVSLLAILQQGTASRLEDVARNAEARRLILEGVKDNTDGITKELVKKSEKAAFAAGKEIGEEIGEGTRHPKHKDT